jgi:23S rRNA (cytosine1962-C5)-methyltransferase
LEEAFYRRKNIIESGSARLVFSEADFIPGLILDFYSGVAVLQSNTAGIDMVLPILEKIIPDVFKAVFGESLTALVIHADTSIRKLEGIENFSKIVFGDKEKIASGSFIEEGVHYAANFLTGQKTGFFLDQRDNRLFLGDLLSGETSSQVLDLFCYSGGWGLRALKSGAALVTFVDQSQEAIDLSKRGISLNKFEESKADFVVSDVFEFLEKESRLYDIVVADPPAFVKSKKDMAKAVRAYEKLNRLAWRRLKPGGLLISSSCSYHLFERDFLGILNESVSKEHGLAHVVYRGGQAQDHPILLSMPETAYLKCIALKKIS